MPRRHSDDVDEVAAAGGGDGPSGGVASTECGGVVGMLV